MPAPDLTQRLVVFVQKEGTDAAGANAVGAPQSRLSIAAALADLAANYPAATSTFFHIVAVGPGTFLEAGIVLPPWTWIVGSCDGEGQPTTVIQLISANVSLSNAWNANSTQRGGLSQLTISPSTGTPILDFTMPVPSAGNPTRTIELFDVHHNLTVEQFQATSTADTWVRELCRQFGTHTDTLTQTGGTSRFKSNWSAAAATIVDATGFAAAGNWDGWIVTDNASSVTVSSVAAAGNATKFTNCAARALTLNLTAPGALAFTADAVSMPIRSLVTYTGTATFGSNVTLLSDAAAEAYSPTTSADWNPVPATVQQALDTLAIQAGGGGSGNTFAFLVRTGNLSSAAWGVNGVAINDTANTFTDTSSSGIVASAVASSFGRPTFAATAGTTYTAAASVYIAGDPIAGSNVTLSATYGLWNAGKTRLDGAVTVNNPIGIAYNGNGSGGTNGINLTNPSGSISGISLSQSGVVVWNIYNAATSGILQVVTGGGVGFTINTIGNFNINSGSIMTAAGATAAAGAWKLGALRTGVALAASTTNVIQLDVAGVLYSLMTCSTNP